LNIAGRVIIFQILAEATSPMEDIRFQRGAISSGDCIGGAWTLVTRQLGLYLGVGIVTMLLISCIPFVNFFLLGPMFGGFYFLVLRDMRDEPVDFGMLFKGFEKFVPLMIVGLIQSAPSIVMTIVQYTVDLARLMGGGIGSGGGDVTFYQTGSDALYAGFSMALIVVFVFLFFFSIAWHLMFSFAVPLVMERDLPVGAALLTSVKAALANPGGLIAFAPADVGCDPWNTCVVRWNIRGLPGDLRGFRLCLPAGVSIRRRWSDRLYRSAAAGCLRWDFWSGSVIRGRVP
jgi:hypothetical protein